MDNGQLEGGFAYQIQFYSDAYKDSRNFRFQNMNSE